jgi:hypothetical protein
MRTTLAAHAGDLAQALHGLCRRLRHAARIEVARAIGEALEEVTRAMICGPDHCPSMPRTASSTWDDPWQEPSEDPWQCHRSDAREMSAEDSEPMRAALSFPAVAMGLGAARWGFLRTRQIGPALLIGLLVALAASAGGPTVKALLEAWSAATCLLSYPCPDRAL